MSDWIFYHKKRNRAEMKRRARLVQKMQKAGVPERMKEILILPSWNKRFKATMKLRAAQSVEFSK